MRRHLSTGSEKVGDAKRGSPSSCTGEGCTVRRHLSIGSEKVGEVKRGSPSSYT